MLSAFFASGCGLLLQIHVLNYVNGETEEAFTQALKFLNRIGGEEAEARSSSAFLRQCRRRREHLLEMWTDGLRSRFGRVNNLDVSGRDPTQKRLEQGIMRASEYKHVGIAKAVGEGFL